MKDRVLYISAFSPFSTEGGGNQRCYNILQILMLKYDVDVIVDFDHISRGEIERYAGVYLIELPDNHASLLNRIFQKIRLIAGFSRFEKVLMRTNLSRSKALHDLLWKQNYKYIIVRYLFMIPYYRLYDQNNLIIDIDDLPALKYASARRSRQSHSFTFEEKKKIKALEKITKQLSAKALLTFLPDKKHLSLIKNSRYLPNIPIYRQNTKLTRTPTNKVLFVGSMSQDMNFLGVDHFVENIWPQVLMQHPLLQLHIIGKGTPPNFLEKWNNIPGIEIRGFVDDLLDEYTHANMAIVPIYNGAGTNIKVLESLAYKCPVILTPFALRGFEDILINNQSVIVVQNDTEFINAVSFIIENTQKADEMAQKGYDIITKKYNIDTMAKYFYSAIAEIEQR